MQRALSTVFLLGLLAATAGAFALTEHLKLMKSPIYATDVTKVFSPVCHCATDKAKISFKLRRAESLTVSIVHSGHVVDTIATGVSKQEGAVTFAWDGLTSSGAVAPDGTYQPRVRLLHEQRTILMPNRIAVDTQRPTVVSVRAGDGILTTGGHLVIEYVLSEKAHAAVYVRGQLVIFGHASKPQSALKWNGKVRHHQLPLGRYVLEVAAVDRAGNETPPADRKSVVVRIRSIALDETSVRVAAGARFTVHVRTAAPQFTWTLAGAHGTSTDKRLSLRAPARRGRYRLVVSEHHHSATASVLVRKK